MDAYQELVATFALVMGVGWASGINLYAAVAALGIAGASGHMQLPPDLEVLASPLVIGAACLMYMVEFFADKTPGVDTGWDALHTFIRLPAGALLAAGAVGEVAPALEIAAGLLGGTLAAGSHLTKASSRVLINASPEPFSNWAASVGEDVLVLGGLWTMLNHPLLFVCLMLVFVGLVIWLLPKLLRLLRLVFQRVQRWFGAKTAPETPADEGAVTETIAADSSPAIAPRSGANVAVPPGGGPPRT